MSSKSERKRISKQQKQQQESKVTLRNFHAEDAAEYLADHRKKCSDPTCETHGLSMDYNEKMVVMLRQGLPNTMFVAVYGTGDDQRDYKPFLALQLEDTGQLAQWFRKDGKPNCEFHSGMSETCLTVLCHREGASLGVFDDHIEIGCRVCHSDSGSLKIKLAARPVVEYPHIYCDVHGIEPLYLTCDHVKAGDYPDALFPVTDTECGVAACRECYEVNRTQLSNACQSFMNILFHGKLKQMLAEREAQLVS